MSVMVSVVMITYNHEQFIEEAVRGVVSQKTTFPFELVIGEDFSTDNTRQVCKALAEEFPDLIRLLPSEKNYGMMSNFIRTYNVATGKYIALCEGDDYWTVENKLQRQYDFLEANEDYSYCFHDCNLVDENGKLIKENISPANQFKQTTFSSNETLHYPFFVNTLSLVFRSFGPLPDFFLKTKMGDKPMVKLSGSRGKGYYFKKTMGNYRNHSGGITKSKSWKANSRREVSLKQDLLIANYLLSINTEISKKSLKSYIKLQQTSLSLASSKNYWRMFYLAKRVYIILTSGLKYNVTLLKSVNMLKSYFLN